MINSPDQDDLFEDPFGDWSPRGSSWSESEGSGSRLGVERPAISPPPSRPLRGSSIKGYKKASQEPIDISNWELGGERGGEPSAGSESTRAASLDAVDLSRAETPSTFPRVGQVVAGFRIVSELGRGAFARVYLAEQADLANRLVALKVSKALGAEPWALARLQHTHIVPIHSVHDDEQTGLRLLCMPYFGGADLAHLLESAGARLPSRADGRSLIEVLDRVGGRTVLPASPSLESPGCPGAFDGEGASLQHPLDPSARSATDRRPSRRSLWRWVSLRGPWVSLLHHAVPAEPDPSQHESQEGLQPFRRFLREATFERAAVWIAARLAEGLDHAHSRGLLHRDLKPSNVLIAADGTPMLLDFNLAVGHDRPDASRGAKALVGGTLPYMSPEHIDAFNPRGTTLPEAVDERSDLYSLGLILFETIVGEHPFDEPPATLPMAELLRLMTEERRASSPSPRASNPKISWSLDSIVRKCLDPDPNLRYLRARDLAEDLGRFLDDRPLRFAPEPSLRERAAKWARRNPWACSWTSVGLFAVVVIALCFGLIRSLATSLLKASAQIEESTFIERFNRCQLLLNTQGPTEHLDSGIALARKTLEPYGVLKDPLWTRSRLVRMLPDAEQRSVREDVGELVMLLSRALVHQAQRREGDSSRRRTLEWAVGALDRVERSLPHPSAALYEDRARYLSALGEADRARRDRGLRDSTPPATSRDFYLLGTSLLAQGNPTEAEKALLRSVDLDPKRYWTWFVLGICHIDQHKFLDASGDFAVCNALAPKFDWPYMNRGLALARAGRPNDARRAYDHALAINPKFIEALVNRGLVCLELDDPRRAELDLARALELGRNEPSIVRDPAILAALGQAQARQGKNAAAERAFASLLEVNPKNATVLVARGFVRLLDPSLHDRASADFLKALEIDDQNERAHLGMAYVLRERDLNAALAELDRAIDIKPGWLDAIEQRALIRARLGRADAINDIDKLAENPTSRRLYDGACATAILARSTHDNNLLARATTLLRKSIELGFPTTTIANDPDLEPLHASHDFQELARKSSSRH